MNQFKTFITILVFSLAILACSLADTSAVPAEPAPTYALPVVEATSGPQATDAIAPPMPAVVETRRLTLEYPPKMRAGVESEVVILTLEMDDFGNITPTAQFEGNAVAGNLIEIPNVYETHNVTVEARLDMAGVDVSPSGATFEPLQPGKSAIFYWSIHPQDVGTYRGTVWLHLNFMDKSSGEESRIAISAQVIEIKAVDFFGLSVNIAKASGLIGCVFGVVLGFPFLEDIIKFIFKKRKTSS